MSGAVAIAVVTTAMVMLFIAGIFLYFYHKFVLPRYLIRNKVANTSFGVNHEDHIKRVGGGNVKGLIVEENGVDTIYTMDIESRQLTNGFPNSIYNPSYQDYEEEEKIIDVMVHRSKISKPHDVPLACESPYLSVHDKLVQPLSALPPSPEFVSPLPLQSQQKPLPMILEKKTQPLPPPPPPPPPPPTPPRIEIPRAPPPPAAAPGPPPLPKSRGFISAMKPPPVPKGKANVKDIKEGTLGESSREKGAGQTRLKPLHWDKVVADVDHSTVWDQINDGSFRFDDELIESLFGFKNQERNRGLSTLAKSNSNTPTQIFILEPRKSQNTAIVLKSLTVCRSEILDALIDGQGLSVETLERLTKIAPSQEEASKIIQFSDNPDKLADAESFLYYILKAVPTAFDRLKAMLFKSNYDCEILRLKEHLQTVEMGCNELRTSGLFLKLLEAILKTGNRMNAGTSRGNAQGFNLSALTKLSDVKSTNNGKISLLHFIVEQVVQSEGRRQAINQNHNILISNMNSLKQQEAENEYVIIGLQVLSGLRDELSEARNAASIEYHNFITMYSTLNAHVSEIRHIITCCGNTTERGGFIKDMKGFIEECEEELKVVKEEQTRIMELVKKTNEYYLAGASKDNMSNPFQLFVIVKDFVEKVDQACIELKRKVEKKNVGVENVLTTPPLSPSKRNPLRFANFDLNSLSNLSESTTSSQSEDDF